MIYSSYYKRSSLTKSYIIDYVLFFFVFLHGCVVVIPSHCCAQLRSTGNITLANLNCTENYNRIVDCTYTLIQDYNSPECILDESVVACYGKPISKAQYLYTPSSTFKPSIQRTVNTK